MVFFPSLWVPRWVVAETSAQSDISYGEEKIQWKAKNWFLPNQTKEQLEKQAKLKDTDYRKSTLEETDALVEEFNECNGSCSSVDILMTFSENLVQYWDWRKELWEQLLRHLTGIIVSHAIKISKFWHFLQCRGLTETFNPISRGFPAGNKKPLKVGVVRLYLNYHKVELKYSETCQ